MSKEFVTRESYDAFQAGLKLLMAQDPPAKLRPKPLKDEEGDVR